MKNQNQLQDNSMPLASLVKPVLIGTTRTTYGGNTAKAYGAVPGTGRKF
ncbi:hypothetical protein [Autumnicola edwardsiae]|uniref:Photosystem II subunit H n=1 Tax=Autumnicola edwardsiae TaxID=3075594 RepID=A0ABU3CVD7_9FLAO|nr:hypothetical protein [Zunongwangia sp. F297]MDT0650329.1 hypothetical protein [Zunongwangia sp. F297]